MLDADFFQKVVDVGDNNLLHNLVVGASLIDAGDAATALDVTTDRTQLAPRHLADHGG